MNDKSEQSSDGFLYGIIALLAVLGVAGAVTWLGQGETPQQMPAEQSESNAVDDFAAKQRAYLDENALKEGVTVTASGLQYRVLTRSNSEVRPAASDAVLVHYAGRLITGEEFDSSYKRGTPISFPLRRVIPGWTEGVQYMAIGDKFEFTIPSALAYGARGTPDGAIPPGATLVFDVELIEILEK